MLDWIMRLLFPPKCVWCGKILDKGEECDRCRTLLPAGKGRTESKEFYSAASAPFLYEGVVRDSILRMKFRRIEGYATVYARYLSDNIRRELTGEFDLVSFVPVSAKRARERGFDQAEAIAFETARLLGMECVRTLRKVRNNERQSRLRDEAERRANVSNCYKCVYDVGGRRVLVIDDIITTGATMSECARELRMAGAEDVVAAAVAWAGKKKR